MKNLLLSLLVLGAGTLACHTAPADQPATAAVAASPAATAMTPAVPPPAAPRYDVRGIFDPGFGGIIAYALKVPHGWLLQQFFKRQWDGAVPNNKVFVSMTSLDKHQAITILPEMRYHFEDGPNARLMQQAAAQQGRTDPTALAPLSPVDYLKKVFVPLFNKQPGVHLRLTGEHDPPPQTLKPGTVQGVGYVEGLLASGRKVRITASVLLQVVLFSPGNSGGSWSALVSLAESDTDLPTVAALSDHISQSLIINPAWQRQDNALKARGNQQNNEQTQAEVQRIAANQARTMQQFHQNVANQQAQRSAINGAFQNRMQASGQAASAYADYMGDQTLYQNPDTGERLKVQGSLGHVYQDAQGTVLNSNQPLSPGSVNWQELQQVELKNY